MHHTIASAIQLDHEDEFKPLTHLFDMPVDSNGNTAIYLNGNSLGPKPKHVEQGLLKECEYWAKLGVRGHFHKEHPWLTYNESLTHSLARLVGAKPEEVVASSTLTANLHATFVSFYRPTQKRFKVIRLAGFPSDTYAIDSQVKQRFETARELTNTEPFPLDEAIIEIKPNEAGYIDLEVFKEILHKHGKTTAIVWIEAVHYLTGQYFNIPEIAQLAHKQGCTLGLDLAHAIGNIPLSLSKWGVDFAVWCSYKYLSGGPGATGGMYVNEKYFLDMPKKIFSGWWGHNKLTRFRMPSTFDPIQSAEAWQVSNSNIFSLAALRQALSIFDDVDLTALREKNKRLVAYLELLINQYLSQDIEIITPKNPEERGCQLSFLIKNASNTSDIENIFFAHGIICDVRGHLVRIAPMGLYTTYLDLFHFIEKLKLICSELKTMDNE